MKLLLVWRDGKETITSSFAIDLKRYAEMAAMEISEKTAQRVAIYKGDTVVGIADFWAAVPRDPLANYVAWTTKPVDKFWEKEDEP